MSRTILVVDDSIVAGRQVTNTVEAFGGYEVVGHAKTGSEAVKLYGELRPDVVLMDIVMPVMDGIQAMRALKKLDDKARVILVSSVGGSGHTVEDALRLGAHAVLSKPLEAEKVKRVLEQLFDKE